VDKLADGAGRFSAETNRPNKNGLFVEKGGRKQGHDLNLSQ
jgi:hypothetical protein